MRYLLLFIEYICVRRLKIFLYKDLLMIASVFLLIYFFVVGGIKNESFSEIYSNLVNILGILLGFGISIFTVFLTIDNKNIETAKKENSKSKLYKTNICLYDCLLVSFAFLLMVKVILLLTNLLLPLFINTNSLTNKVFFSIDISLIVYAIFSLLKNVIDFYFIITRKDENNKI